MKIIRNMIVAFSLYSRIPMPIFSWTEDDMKHNQVFLPWIGAVIGLISFAFWKATLSFSIPSFGRVCIFALIPLLVTGGFHVDGYLDVQDALKSYKSKEEKLEILKDPHIGAFAIIRFAIYGLLWLGALSILVEKNRENVWMLFFSIFAFARCICALMNLKFPHAKKTGMLNMETEKSTNIDFVIIAFECILVLLWMFYQNPLGAGLITIGTIVFAVYYRHLCMKEFGGITGDTAGYSIVSLEGWLIILLACVSYTE